MQHLLQDSTFAFGVPPRQFTLLDRLTYLRFPRPYWLWLNPFDNLNQIYRNLGPLLKEGVVVWGHIIQANSKLFEPGSEDLPASIVFSLEDSERTDPKYLRKVSQNLYGLKGTTPTDPDLRAIAAYLTSEVTRVIGLPVPRTVSPTRRCLISSTMLFRKHLPGRRLCRSFFPLVVNPTRPHVAVVLPGRYWPRELLRGWTS